jgi:hypothetical protein
MTDRVVNMHLPLPSYVFNGLVQHHVQIQDHLMSHFSHDQQRYQSLAQQGLIRESDEEEKDNDNDNDASRSSSMDLLDILWAQEPFVLDCYCPWFHAPEDQHPRRPRHDQDMMALTDLRARLAHFQENAWKHLRYMSIPGTAQKHKRQSIVLVR